MGKGRGTVHSLVFDYDFSKDGGAVGQVDLRARPSDGLQEGLIVKQFEVLVKEAVTSAGSPTVTFGPEADPDGFLADVYGSLGSAGNVVRSGEVAGALLWDDTNDHELNYRIGSAANTQNLQMDIGTAALTGGKLEIHVEAYMPVDE
jgi:hypothetical protein